MMEKLTLYSRSCTIKGERSDITVNVPLVKDLINDDSYYHVASILTATPTDMMVELDDNGIDFTTISDFDLFCMMYHKLDDVDTSLVLPGINFNDFELAINNQTEEVVLWNQTDDIVIDKRIHKDICDIIRKILNVEKNVKIPANKEAKDYLLERARIKLKRRMRRMQQESDDLTQLEKYIVSIVCAPEFSYTYESVLGITIYQFNLSLMQVIKRVEFDKLMVGMYAGTLKADSVDKSKLNWIMN